MDSVRSREASVDDEAPLLDDPLSVELPSSLNNEGSTELLPDVLPSASDEAEGGGIDSALEDREDSLANDSVPLNEGRSLVKGGMSFNEVGLIANAGFNAIERMRRRRGTLLFFYLIGCVFLITLVFLSFAASMNRNVRVAPSKTFVAQADPADINPDVLRSQAELLVARMNTWSRASMPYVANVVSGYLAPSMRDRVRSDFERLRENIRQSNLSRYALPLGSVYQGADNDVHTVWVAYERIELTGREARDTRIHRRVNTLAIMSFVSGVPTDENRRGIYLLRVTDYEEEEWLRLGGRNIWAALRRQAEER